MSTLHALTPKLLLALAVHSVGTGTVLGQRDVSSPIERANILSLLAARYEVKLNSVRTWSATYDFTVTAPFPIYPTPDAGLPPSLDNVRKLIRTQHFEFTFDLDNSKEQVFIKAHEDPSRATFRDATGNSESLPSDYPYIHQREEILIRDGFRYTLDLQFPRGPLTGFRDDPLQWHPQQSSLVIDQVGHFEFGRLDPRNLFRAGQREYLHESLRSRASIFQGRHGTASADYYAQHCKMQQRITDDGRNVIDVEMQFKPNAGARNGDQTAAQYDLASGLPLEYTARSGKTQKICHYKAWEYSEDRDSVIPLRYRNTQHHPATGELHEDTEWLLRKSTVNGVIDDSKFDLARLASEDGVRLANHIDRSVRVWSASEERFIVATSGDVAAATVSATNHVQIDAAHWLLIVSALGFLVVTGILVYRGLSKVRRAE